MSILHSKTRGAAIMLSLWALFLLSAMIISWALDIDSHLVVGGQANRILEAEAMACSGSEVALHPSVKPGSPNLSRRVNARESDRMIDCLLDWVDPDNLVRLNGAEDSEDYHPANRLLTRIDDLKKVKGWLEFTSVPGWDNDLTLNSNGPIDLTWASRDVLLALPGMTEAIIDNFLQTRRGPDGVDGTQDDAEFKDPNAVRAALNLTTEQFKQLNGLIGFKDPVFRVVSVGKSGDTTRVVQMVFRRIGSNPQMITWKEL
jgi:hypothetical protein